MKPLTDEELDRLIAEHNEKGGKLAAQGARQSQGCWDSGIKIIKGCGHMEIPAYLIRFSQLAHEKIECLKRAYPSLEWLAYLEGRIDHESREVFVDNLIIPDSQIVSGAHVGEVEYGWNEGKAICGVIHSHNTMGAFFSGTDDAYINQNHDVSICVSTRQGREICAQVRVKTPCGSYIINEKVSFKVDYAPALDEKEFMAEFTPKIKTYRVISTFQRPADVIVRKGVQGANSVRGGQRKASTNRHAQLQPTGTVQNPFEMDEEELAQELSRYYSDYEVQEFEEMGWQEMAVELENCYSALGYDYYDDEEDPDDPALFTLDSEDDTGWDTRDFNIEKEPETVIKEVLN